MWRRSGWGARRRSTGSSARGAASTSASRPPTVSLPRASPTGTSSWTGIARPSRSPRRSMSAFDTVPEQHEAKRLLTAALADGDAHAFLLHGPAGVGKTAASFAYAAALLGDARRVAERTHPDLRIVEPLGEMIRIDAVRELHHDLHLRPFEADRRVSLLLGAPLLNDDAADALLKDLEEPPLYATIVLVADELGPIPETIRSRCQLVPFRRLSERAVRDWLAAEAPGLAEEE